MKRLKKDTEQVASTKGDTSVRSTSKSVASKGNRSNSSKISSGSDTKKRKKTIEKKVSQSQIVTPADTGAWKDKGNPIYAAISDTHPGL